MRNLLGHDFLIGKSRLWLAERAKCRGSHGGAPETGFKGLGFIPYVKGIEFTLSDSGFSFFPLGSRFSVLGFRGFEVLDFRVSGFGVSGFGVLGSRDKGLGSPWRYPSDPARA